VKEKSGEKKEKKACGTEKKRKSGKKREKQEKRDGRKQL
jgi:hypothetical protein